MSQNKTQGATSAAAADTHSSAGAGKDSTDLDHSLPSGAAMDLSHVSPSRHPLNRLRRLSKEEPYVHSVAQTSFAGVGRLRNRRQSDPGRISVSPIRLRARALDNEIAESEELCHHPRLHALRSISMTVPEEMTPEEEEERSRPRERARQRAMRSNSLPTGDGPGFLEIGEAIGAVAMTQPPTIAELPPLVENITLSPNLMQARRRRSISMESTSLEAIDEDNNEVLGKKASSHVTPPSRTIHT